MSTTPQTTYLKDYTPANHLVETVDLKFILGEEGTDVHSTVVMRKNPEARGEALVLNGLDLQLVSLSIDGKELSDKDYEIKEEELHIENTPEEFTLKCHTRIHPEKNTALEGLYKSSGMFCTQCESEGFRRITYYPDRPDVMAKFTTRIEGDKKKYPILLSNGNCIEKGELEDGRHYAVWEDPFKKPCYLFALVAGDLAMIEDKFTTMGGRAVTLQIFSEPENIDKCPFAMQALKKAMKWDEERFGREYDLDIFMIVAVNDFNMGAMENKGLNIFNASALLATPKTTGDARHEFVEAVVAHEYFHNWSGNRVTCRDWFQLSLKEGFTVFRDQEFTSDMMSRTIKRVEDVNGLRTSQFAEDAGPMAHPVRPASYMEISNFYTLTVYEKGAEVVRMWHTLLGAETFRKACDLYFDRHDGQAVTCDDFAKCMAETSGMEEEDFNQFMLWYSQAGTPKVAVTSAYDATTKTYSLSFAQSCPPTPECAHKKPFLIPIKLGLVGPAGEEVPLSSNHPGFNAATGVFQLKKEEDTVVFENVAQVPVPSLFRGFSAPVKVNYAYQPEDLLHLMQHDADGFNRWNAAQDLSFSILMNLIEDVQNKQDLALDGSFIEAVRNLLARPDLDKSMIANMIALPSAAALAEKVADAGKVVDVFAIYEAREFTKQALAMALEDELTATYNANNTQEAYQFNATEVARRSLKNICLGYLMSLEGHEEALSMAKKQFKNADNMTDQGAALSALVVGDFPQAAKEALENFYQQFKHDDLVLETWFALQASSPKMGTLEEVKRLMQHEKFAITNPNKVRALIGAFVGNAIQFHKKDGSGYQFLAEMISQIDELNPQMAARLVVPFTKWKRYDANIQARMKTQLEILQNKKTLSKDTREVVVKSLA